MSPQWSSDALARWSVSLSAEALPEAVLAKAEDCILDAVACAVVGRASPATLAVEAVASEKYRDGPAAIWFAGRGLHPIGAAFVNANAASILDIDDGHRAALGHPGAAVVPSVLALAAARQSSGLELLAAIVVGYEAAVRIGRAERRKAYHTGNWTSFGAAAASARLLWLDAEGHAQALAISAYHGPRVADLTLSRDMGRSVKESIPWSVVAGMSAAELAGQGFTGCRDALDLDERFEPGAVTDALGEEFLILGTYFKRYSACRWVHAAIELLLGLMAEHGVRADDIASVDVETFDQAAGLDNLADPPTLESAQYSVPYCLGLAATSGEAALMPLIAESLHHGPAVALAEKVRIATSPEMNAKFPGRAPAGVTIETVSGATFSAATDSPWGEGDSGVSRADLLAKFHSLADGLMAPARIDAIADAVAALRCAGPDQLFALLSAPLDADQHQPRRAAHG